MPALPYFTDPKPALSGSSRASVATMPPAQRSCKGCWYANYLEATWMSPSGLVCRQLPRVIAFSPASTNSFSRSFQMASSSADGAVPIRPA